MQIIKYIWVLALMISLPGLILSILASIILWRNGPRDRLKYILPVIPIFLAAAIRSSVAIFLR